MYLTNGIRCVAVWKCFFGDDIEIEKKRTTFLFQQFKNIRGHSKHSYHMAAINS